jgi:hypothetical protein
MSSPVLRRFSLSVPVSCSKTSVLQKLPQCLRLPEHNYARQLATATSVLDVQERAPEHATPLAYPVVLHELSSQGHAVGSADVRQEYGRMLAAALLSQSRNDTLRLTVEEDPNQKQPGGPTDPDEPEISDQEWEIRTGTLYSTSALE